MKIEYFYSLASLFTFLGSEKFQAIVKKYGAEIIKRPCDLVEGIFSKTEGVPVPQRSLQRERDILDELKRWSNFFNIKINVKLKFFSPKDSHMLAKYTIAANLLGSKIFFRHDLLKKS